MLGWIAFFLLMTVATAVLGFGGVIGVVAGVAQFAFAVSFLLLIATLIASVTIVHSVPDESSFRRP